MLVWCIFPHGVSSSAAAAPMMRNYDDLRVGDVVALGTPDGTSCFFGHFGIQILVHHRESRSIQMSVASECQLIVVALGESSVAPTPWLPQLPGHSSQVDNGTGTDPTPDAWFGHSVLTVVQMYGFGGNQDILTQKQNQLDYQEDGSTAQATDSGSGNCTWDSATGWVNDACVFDGQAWGPSFQVWRESHGDFHWPPGNSYYHTLHAKSYGDATGNGLCSWWYDGSIVAGVRSDCYKS